MYDEYVQPGDLLPVGMCHNNQSERLLQKFFLMLTNGLLNIFENFFAIAADYLIRFF